MAATAVVERHDGEARLVMARVARTFDLATRLLPLDVRTDVRRLYLVLRTLDDAVDHGDPAARRRIAAVEGWAAGGARGGGPGDGLPHPRPGRRPGTPPGGPAGLCAGVRAES